ncbi:1-aminocyclopropane-1-carboxylate deaminase [Campylobacter corcagiensis]|uniref:1-aminocyclopropane-1-carboxylate deaminase n=1 Tax=Campylobacter corcagiensis TaxID=1448857 RepID=A0A7M1LK12_9BACT|nr:1-aminocyclopropane-1-carboxylate deaminase [Campylobacter corcagiensis]
MTKPRFDRLNFKGVKFWLLRDDLLGEFNGNKARKLKYFLNADLSKYKSVVSHGSSQSNAMQSLSVFAKIKGLEFRYVVNYLNPNLKASPVGNLKFALKNGMKLYESGAKNSDDRREFALSLCDENSLFIEEGVAMKEAEYGFIDQAKDIENFANGAKFDIFLPSGTGTSAGYLAKHSKFRVFTCPTVGTKEYLKKQLDELNLGENLEILNPPKKYRYAQLRKEFIEIYKELLEETKVEFDLIYDPVGLLTLFTNLDKFENEILYIHQGGLLGNISQLQRYKDKEML